MLRELARSTSGNWENRTSKAGDWAVHTSIAPVTILIIFNRDCKGILKHATWNSQVDYYCIPKCLHSGRNPVNYSYLIQHIATGKTEMITLAGLSASIENWKIHHWADWVTKDGTVRRLWLQLKFTKRAFGRRFHVLSERRSSKAGR